jgi:hypothetical protein
MLVVSRVKRWKRQRRRMKDKATKQSLFILYRSSFILPIQGLSIANRSVLRQ